MLDYLIFLMLPLKTVPQLLDNLAIIPQSVSESLGVTSILFLHHERRVEDKYELKENKICIFTCHSWTSLNISL